MSQELRRNNRGHGKREVRYIYMYIHTYIYIVMVLPTKENWNMSCQMAQVRYFTFHLTDDNYMS